MRASKHDDVEYTVAGHDTVAEITPYTDGPLIVRGPFRLVDDRGRPIDAGRATVALCRCGRSSRKPFCDSSHKTGGFRASSGRDADPKVT